ncbi:hypothetical protein GDO78_018544 [Eleutherodactylus coqui]|uniref:G-protein coupled receptors family 1 profile domain-containing protein n=1 Tax=Eleutherodactylus coqui TaxID=57060 RepID=A0A8J6ECL0_ELECQ|nr:hypothetical protein GDO78_018544 [Eleutherodactylus coqui]
MNDCPNSSSKHEFTIVAFSLSSSGQLGLSLGILIIYAITIWGNLAIVFLVSFVPKLHTPMYFFLVNLAVVDVTASSTCVPKLLFITLTRDHRISFSCCMTQIYFYVFSADGEVFMLTSMAYDRYVAIFISLSTTNNESQKIFIFFELCVIYLGQFILTIISYVFIFSAILKIRSSTGRMKAFSSCTSHIITVILYYVPSLFLYMKTDSEECKEQDTLISMIYLVLVPMLNPLVYSMRNKDVWGAFVMLTNNKMLKL